MGEVRRSCTPPSSGEIGAVAVTHPAAIVVPESSEMSEGQRRGQFRVWCSQALWPNKSIDLGERIGEDDRRWFPRSCPLCAAQQVYLQLLAHVGCCEQCVDEDALCPASALLRRALRQGRSLAAETDPPAARRRTL